MNLFFFLAFVGVHQASDIESSYSRFHLLGGLSGGYSGVQTDISTELDKDGFHFDAELLGSYRFDFPFALDVGFGWIFNRMTGSGGVVVEDTVKTYGPFIDLSGRYVWSEHWQVGIISKHAFGTDFNFGGSTSRTDYALLMGPQIVYENDFSRWLIRVSLQGLTDVNIAHRQAYMALAGVQIGLPMSVGDRLTGHAEPRVEVTDIAELQDLKFEVGSANLVSADIKLLKRLAGILKKYSKDWQKLFIGGHTDSRGSDRFNLRLSESRARSVRSVFASAGIASKLMEIQGFGYHQPRVEGQGEEVWKQNRRVEIKLLGPVKTEIVRKIQKEIAE
jgi:outer membrane protein OmpA-like peptidoglycan-associated protein